MGSGRFFNPGCPVNPGCETVPGILKLRAWFFPIFTTDMRICYLTAFYLVLLGAVPANGSGLVTIVRLLVSIGLYGAWGVLVNDWVDRDLDAAAGKRTGLEVAPPYQVRILFLLLPILGVLLIPQPLANPQVLVILAAAYLLALFYSAPAGWRLKEKGAWGFLADVVLEKPLPSLMLFAFYDHLCLDALVLAAFYSTIGAFTLALHQLWDYDSDMAHGVRTMAVALGREKLFRAYKLALEPLFLLTAALSLVVIALGTGLAGVASLAAFAAASVVFVYLSLRGIIRRDDPNRRGVSPEVWFVHTFFDGPLPTLLGIFVLIEAPIFLPVFLALFASQFHKFRRHYRQAFQKAMMALKG